MTPNEGEGVILSDWMAAGGGVLGAMGSVASGIMNYMSQSDTLAWQKAAQEKTWQREDTAVQRRAADLKAAGLNPVLAAGSAAQTGSPVTLRAPQLDLGNPGGQLVNAASAVQSIHQSQAQADLLRQQQANAEAVREGVELDNKLKEATLGSKVGQAAAESTYAVKSVADRLDKLQSEKDSAFYKSAMDQLDWAVQSAVPGEHSDTYMGRVAEIKKEYLRAQKAAVDQGISLDKARTAALASAVAAAGADEKFLKESGLSPAKVDMWLEILKTAAGVATAAAKMMPF